MNHSKVNEGNNKNNENLKIILTNLSLKLGVKSTSEIVPFLKKKLNDLKTLNPIKYNEIMNKCSANASEFIKA